MEAHLEEKEESDWQRFTRTGAVEDYLRYAGVLGEDVRSALPGAGGAARGDRGRGLCRNGSV